jgi:hypothetical protein
MRAKINASMFIAAACVLASCATLMGPRQVEIPVARLQEAVATKFPFNNRYLELLDISVTNPKIALQPETNRILTSMDTVIAPSFLKNAWKGNISVSGNLKFDPSRNALVLGDPRVERFAIDGNDMPYANQIIKVGNLLVEQLLQDATLYTFTPEDLRYGGADFILSKITTKPNSLVVTFEPTK